MFMDIYTLTFMCLNAFERPRTVKDRVWLALARDGISISLVSPTSLMRNKFKRMIYHGEVIPRFV